MKRLLLSIVFMTTLLWSVETVEGVIVKQVWINNVHTEPNQPTNTDSITIFAAGTASSGRVVIEGSNFQMQGSSLEVDIFFRLGPYGGGCPWSHSEVIGTLSANSYDLAVRAYSYSPLTDTYELTDTYLTSFTVAPQEPPLLVPDDYPTIQAAIDAAVNGDTVLVADGTYTGPGNRDIDFLGKAIIVRSTDPNDPNIVAATIIDCNGTETDPHRGFYFHSGEDANSVLDGFNITNGEELWGGGIYCRESSPTITNCIISGNSAWIGGGIFCEESSLTITNCIISGNSASYLGGGIASGVGNPSITNCAITDNSAGYRGGGIYCEWSSSPTITDCIINANYARYEGGGIQSSFHSDPTITNCTIVGNIADGGGGISCLHGSSPTITNCTITGNSASYSGGGISCVLDSSPTITNCIISGNSARHHHGGGGISCEWESNPTITNCTIVGNWADRGGGIDCVIGSNPTITSCTISGNKGKRVGGGIDCLESNPAIINCTIVGNTAPRGGGIYIGNSSISTTITNCILWDNLSEQIYGHPSITYSDIQQQDEWPWWDYEGCISADPCFVQPGYWDVNCQPDDDCDYFWDYFWVEGDYHLLQTSLCIDAGDPNYIAEPNETDLDGNPRVINGRIDMGAYETNYIQAAMKFTPQMLNCNSKGKYVKAHITLPEGFLPEDVDVNAPAIAEPIGIESEYIKVLGVGQVKLEICFDREAFCDGLTETGEIEITVIGSLTAGRYFYASDTIKMKP